MTTPTREELLKLDAAFEDEIKRISELEFNSNAICRTFFSSLRERFATLLQAQGEPSKPYAYEYGHNNGDGTYSVQIHRGEFPNYITPHKDWLVKALYAAPPSSGQVWNEAIETAAISLESHPHLMTINEHAKLIRSLKRPSQAQEPAILPQAPLDPLYTPVGGDGLVSDPSVSSAVDERDAFEKWKDDYALTAEPNYSKHTEADCLAAFKAGIEFSRAQAAQPAPAPSDQQREAVMAAIAGALGDAYDCMRVWAAWGYGTMTQDDFRLVADDAGRLAEIADAAIAAMGAQPAQQIEFTDQWECKHTLTPSAAANELKAFYDAWPGGLEEVEAALKATAQKLTVWYGAMPESNGKSNFTAILIRKDGKKWDNMTDGHTIACSEYPDRVRYEADRVRYLIGELAERPSILDYDADKHSGYVEPAAAPTLNTVHVGRNINGKLTIIDPQSPAFNREVWEPVGLLELPAAAIPEASLLNSIAEAARCLGVVQEKGDKSAAGHWANKVDELVRRPAAAPVSEQAMPALIAEARRQIAAALPEDEPDCVPDWACELLIKVGAGVRT